jgi:hypothetical protein
MPSFTPEDTGIMTNPIHDAVLHQFSRSLAEEGYATDFLKRFGRYRLPVGRELGAMMNHLAMFIEGYDDDPREIYAIPEVRRFMLALSAIFSERPNGTGWS